MFIFEGLGFPMQTSFPIFPPPLPSELGFPSHRTPSVGARGMAPLRRMASLRYLQVSSYEVHPGWPLWSPRVVEEEKGDGSTWLVARVKHSRGRPWPCGRPKKYGFGWIDGVPNREMIGWWRDSSSMCTQTSGASYLELLHFLIGLKRLEFVASWKVLVIFDVVGEIRMDEGLKQSRVDEGLHISICKSRKTIRHIKHPPSNKHRSGTCDLERRFSLTNRVFFHFHVCWRECAWSG